MEKIDIKKALSEKLVSNEFIIELTNIFNNKYNNAYLVGGAIIDILENRVPKDYDLIQADEDILFNNGFVFECETLTAITYKRDGIIVQILKTTIDNFDYKISQSKLNLYTKTLEIHLHSFINKDLIPVSFESKKALNSLRRLPHWKKKGYSLHDNTYHSLLNSASKIYMNRNNINS